MNKDIYHIASDYFRGSISNSDLSYLQHWLKQSHENKLLLDELEQVWKQTGELNFDLTSDVEAEWQYFVKEREKEISPGIEQISSAVYFKTDRQIMLGKFLRIAAVIVPVLLIISISYFYLKSRVSPVQWVLLQTINEKKECILSDGSKVWVNKHSSFSYPAKFSKNERVVKLEGEAFFEIEKGNAPFKINAGKTAITVIGTAFNVRAYQPEKIVEVVVSRGKVKFEAQNSLQQMVMLGIGDKGTYDESANKISQEKVSDFSLTGWKDNLLSFHNTPLNEVQSAIARYFNVYVQINPAMQHCKITGDFKQPRLNELLSVISISLNANYQVNKDTVFLNGPGCGN